MRFTVGGEDYDLTKERVARAMRGVPGEPIQKHLVEIDDRVYPPKQVFAAVTSRPRTSFTTMEAQRVLRRLGFVCRPVGASDTRDAPASSIAVVADKLPSEPGSLEARIATLEAAIAGLHARVVELERVS